MIILTRGLLVYVCVISVHIGGKDMVDFTGSGRRVLVVFLSDRSMYSLKMFDKLPLSPLCLKNLT